MKRKMLDYINFEQFNSLLEGFNKSTGFVTAIIDLEGNVISKSGWRKICTHFHRVNPSTQANCLESDTILANRMIENKSYHLYKCRNGLVDVVVPIKIKGELVANLFTGQFFLDEPDVGFFKKQAERYSFDENAYINALKEVPIVTEKQVEDILSFLQNLTQGIIDLTIEKIERENSEMLLKSSLESPIDFLILAIDKNYNYLYFNQTYQTHMKEFYHTNIYIGSNLIDFIEPNEEKINTKKNYDKALDGKSFTRIEKYDDSPGRIFEAAYNPIYDDNNEVIGCTVFAKEITERILVEKQLKESEQRFKILHNASFGGIAVHDKSCILECNQGLSDITGYSINELVGMSSLLLVTHEYRDFVMDKIESSYEKPYEAFGIRKNGEIYPVRLEARSLPYDGKQIRVVEFRDITELKKQEELKKQSEEQYRLLTSEMQLGLALGEIICDKDGNPNDFRFVSVNKSWERIMEVNRKVVIGKTILEVFPNTEKSWIDSYGEVALTRKSIKLEHYSIELDKYLSMSVYSPKKGFFATVVEDITEKRKQEELIDYSLKHDTLTGLPNRNYYIEKLVELDMEENYPLAIVMMDVNGLKLINDSFGQEAGNEVLRQFAKILSEEKREVDFITRTSGDEFMMLSPKTSSDEVFQFKQRLLEIISKQKINNIVYSIAIGFDVKETRKQEISEIVTEAENAMYKNKIVYGQGTRSEAIESVFSTLTNKYEYEKTHSERVAKYSRLIGKQLNLREDELDELELAGRLHDIGKIAISDEIIMKPGKLNEEEWRKIKDHTVIGYQILRAADKYSNLAEYAMSHHERMDGKGYPNGLLGKDIPLFARIICVADAYEAMTSDRTYRKAMKKEVAINELQKYAGTQFDQEIVDVFIRAISYKN